FSARPFWYSLLTLVRGREYLEAKSPHDAPAARSWAISAGETGYEAGGLPTCFPSAFARESPDRMRSLMRTVSTFAIVARIPTTMSRNGPRDVRYDSRKLTKSTPEDPSRWRMSIASLTPARVSRSKAQKIATSNRR